MLFLASPPGWFVAIPVLGLTGTICLGVIAASLIKLALTRCTTQVISYRTGTNECKNITPSYIKTDLNMDRTKNWTVGTQKFLRTLFLSPILDLTYFPRAIVRAGLGTVYKFSWDFQFNVLQDLRLHALREKLIKRNALHFLDLTCYEGINEREFTTTPLALFYPITEGHTKDSLDNISENPVSKNESRSSRFSLSAKSNSNQYDWVAGGSNNPFGEVRDALNPEELNPWASDD